jgi:hypothetical protein
MIPQQGVKDLIVLAADQSMKLAIGKLLARTDHIGVRQISAEVYTHPDRDPGVLRRSHEYLRQYWRQYEHAIAICDREGSGRDSPRDELEGQIEERLRANGWDDRASAIVIDPELETWMWGDWVALTRSAGWRGDGNSLKEWLRTRTLLKVGEAKPQRPKETLESVLKENQMPWSSAIHEKMAATADTTGCVDGAFLKLKSTLQRWFPK